MQNVTFNCDGCGKKIEAARTGPDVDATEARKEAAFFHVTVRPRYVIELNCRDGNGVGENYQSHAAQSIGTLTTREFCRGCAESKTLLELLK